jgi:putative transposase
LSFKYISRIFQQGWVSVIRREYPIIAKGQKLSKKNKSLVGYVPVILTNYILNYNCIFMDVSAIILYAILRVPNHSNQIIQNLPLNRGTNRVIDCQRRRAIETNLEGDYTMAQLSFPSDLTDEEWATLAPQLPPAKSGGRPRSVDLREVANGILYVLINECSWRGLPEDFPPWQTVYAYYRKWVVDKCWEHIATKLAKARQDDSTREYE